MKVTRPRNLVISSHNDHGETICVDIFQRPDQSFGFEEYRRDPEDGRGWFPVGHYADRRYDTYDAAKSAAANCIGWFRAGE